jgi:hypothetical protein
MNRTSATAQWSVVAAIVTAVAGTFGFGVARTATAAPVHVISEKDWNPFGQDVKPPAPTPPVRGAKLNGARPARTNISNIIYINDCLPDGCDVRPGSDHSGQNTSSIVDRPVRLSGFPHGAESWKRLVRCMEDTYSLFDLKIVTEDPGNTPHSEVMFGGRSTDFDPSFSAGGVAPYLSCGATEEHGLSFVFAAQTSSLDFLCWAGVQESSHVFGLDHQLDAKDPLTYLYPPYHKEFQDSDAQCGEKADRPRDCFCGGNTQNTTKYLLDVFGPGTPVPPTIAILAPKNGAYVAPGFPVKADVTGRFLISKVDLAVDGSESSSLIQFPYIFNAPTPLSKGEHTVTVTAAGGAAPLSTSIKVNVLGTCAAGESCDDGFTCLSGVCLPGPSIVGGLGATCATDADCFVGSCASDGDKKYCTAPCDAEKSCPNKFSCLDTSATSSVCWPTSGDGGGGCAVVSSNSDIGGGTGSGALVALGSAMFVGVCMLRRRR